jgi:hypothetical protein
MVTMSSYRWNVIMPLLVGAIPTVAAFGMRSIGSGGDPDLDAVVENCTAQFSFERAQCSALMECALERMPGDVTADFGSGSNIASIVPTILIGASPSSLPNPSPPLEN